MRYYKENFWTLYLSACIADASVEDSSDEEDEDQEIPNEIPEDKSSF